MSIAELKSDHQHIYMRAMKKKQFRPNEFFGGDFFMLFFFKKKFQNVCEIMSSFDVGGSFMEKFAVKINDH